MRVDLHSHTSYSWDGLCDPSDLIAAARREGLDRIAVTDHNTIDGALHAQELAPDLVIVGEEIMCADATEVIGLFLRERIPPGLSVAGTIDRIRAQDGAVYLPHPFAYLRGGAERARRAVPLVDIVEVFNARAFLPSWNRRAAEAAANGGLVGAAGSDAHRHTEIGRAWTEMDPFETASEFRAVMHSMQPRGSRCGTPLDHVITVSAGVMRACGLMTGGAAMRPATSS